VVPITYAIRCVKSSRRKFRGDFVVVATGRALAQGSGLRPGAARA
jgi:hypothetical protein